MTVGMDWGGVQLDELTMGCANKVGEDVTLLFVIHQMHL
jgi:hypothetical protein